MFSTIRAVAAGFSVVAAALSYGPVQAQPPQAQTVDPQQMKMCDGRGNVPDEVQISACTQVIKSGRSDTAVLNIAFFYRGLTYAQTGRCRLAIPDFTAAIRNDPKDADAYWSRHACKKELGDNAGADADKKAAQAIDPRIEDQWIQ